MLNLNNINVSVLFQYIKAVRHLDGYCEVSFPHCPCDSRKEGHVIAIVGRNCFKLQACKTDGTIEVRITLNAVLIHSPY